LHRRLNGKNSKGRVRAKTGTILKASCLSGYATTASGKLVAFSVLVNDYRVGLWKARTLQDAVCEALCEYQG
jgi:D-alanyl-D-alanine carboxypeptidase/D-alanyl-D-alanine-endopeptidase (penicillin-binding protein 4)